MTKQEIDNIIRANIYTNNQGLITGATLQSVLLEMVDYALREMIISTDTEAELTDENHLSSLRVLAEILKNNETFLEDLKEQFLSKVTADTANGLIKFLAGAEFGEFLSGILGGKGARIDELGNIEATSLDLRGSLSAPEYRFNRITFVGDETIFSDMGTIEEVALLEGRLYRLTMRLEDDDNLTFKVGDLVKGIYHYNTYGFSTSYMRVESVIDEYMEVLLVDNEDTPTLSNYPPTQFMKIARVGYAGVDFPERSRYVVASSKAGGIQVWDGCVDFLSGRIVASMDLSQAFKSQYGPLPTKNGLPYLYAAGIVTEDIIRVDYEGVPVREINDRGPWRAGVIYYNNDDNGTDDVWHLGVRWRCFASSTTEEPSWTSADWVNIEGRPNMMIVIEQYYTSTSSSELVGGEWTEEIPIWEEGRYIYSRSKILYQDGSETFTDPVYVPILNGKSVTKIDVEYATSSSRQIAPTEGWQTTDPGVQPGEYLWSRTTVYYSDGNHEIFGEACISGNDGEAGKDAVAPIIIDDFWAFWDEDTQTFIKSTFSAIGDDGHSPYVDELTGTWFQWNGTAYEDTGITAKGEKGDDGSGILEVIDYYGVSSSASILPATWYNTVPTKGANQYLWNYERVLYTDGTYDETEPRVIQGKDAKSISTVVNQYVYSSSGTSHPTSGWKPTISELGAKPEGYFLWVRDFITYTDDTTDTTKGYVVTDGEDGEDGEDGITISQNQQGYTYRADLNGDIIGSLANGMVELTITSGSTPITCPSSTSGGTPTTNGTYRVTRTLGNGITTNSSLSGGKYRITPATLTVDEASVELEIRIMMGGVVTSYPLTLTYRKQFDGADGKSTEFIFKGDISDTIAPALPSTSQQDDWYGQGTANEWNDDLVEPTKALPYVWASQRKKVDGVWGAFTTPKVWLRYADGITSTTIEYAKSSIGTTPPSSGWSTSLPSPTEGWYLWTRTTTTYRVAVTTVSYSVSHWAKDGDGIVSTTIEYAKSSSGTTIPTSGWSTSLPTPTKGWYLWTRTTTVYKTSPTTVAYSISYWSEDGESGYTVLLSNGSHTFAGAETTALTGSTSTQILVYRGVERVFPTSITVNTADLPTGMSRTISLETSIVTFNVTTSMTSPSGTIPITFVVNGRSMTALFSYSISFKGSKGEDSAIIRLTGDTQFISVNKAGTVIPLSNFTVVGTAENTSISSWRYAVDSGSPSTTPPTGVSRSGNIVTINPNTSTFKLLTIIASDGTVSDSFSIARVTDGGDGEDGYSVSLSRSEHTFNYDKNGNLKGVLSDGTISVEVLNGSNPHICDSTAVSPPTLDGTYRVTGITISPSTTLSYNVDRLNNVFRLIPTQIDAEEVMVSLTIVARAKGINTTFTRQLKYQKSHDGADGTGGTDGTDGDSVVHIYKQYPTKPAAPSSGVSNPAGWSRNPDYILSIVSQTNWTLNGNWYQWVPESGTYEDTGIKAEGAPGEDPVAPIIIDDFWAFWDDAGREYVKSAFSAIGDDGHSPSVWANGNWYQSEELTAIGNSTTSRITFTTAKDAQTITLELWADGHATYDYVYAGKLDTAASTSNYYNRVRGGRIIIAYEVPTAGSHYIDIFWRKGISTIVGSNRGYYAIISDVKVWRSTTNVIGGVAQAWSEPRQFEIDSALEERIYCLSKTTTAPDISDSDAYINDYIPLPCSLSSYCGDFTTNRAYSIGQVVRYRLQYYKVIKYVLSSYTGDPSNTQYFEMIPGWTDNPTGANKDFHYEIIAIRKKQSDGLWGSFVPSVWSNYGIGTNYIHMGWWNPSITYYKTELGIPLVKKEDGTGYSAYTLKVSASTPGSFIFSEWDLVETADFIYMEQAYIERLQAQLISAVTVELKEDSSSNVTAGLSGIQGAAKDKPAFWAGGIYDEATSGIAKAIVRHDGSGQLAGGNISWGPDGGVRSEGSFSGPFANVTDIATAEGIDYYFDKWTNNIYVKNTSGQIKYINIPCDEKFNGQVVRIHSIKGTTMVTHTSDQSLPFFDGEATDTVQILQGNAIEMICICTSEGFLSWDVIKQYKCRII